MANKAFPALEEIFTNRITVINIAVPTKPLNLQSAKKACRKHNFDAHLVKNTDIEDLQVYIRKEDIIRPIHDSEVISESTPILEVMEVLCEKEQLFIKVKRNITQVVSLSDLDSIPVRIWLYGMISLFEIELKATISSDGIHWPNLLSPKRIDKASKLFELKKQNNEEIDLLGCTMLIDVGTIISRSWEQFAKYFPAEFKKKEILSAFNQINKLRDALAHGQRLNMEWRHVYKLVMIISYTLKKI